MLCHFCWMLECPPETGSQFLRVFPPFKCLPQGPSFSSFPPACVSVRKPVPVQPNVSLHFKLCSSAQSSACLSLLDVFVASINHAVTSCWQRWEEAEVQASQTPALTWRGERNGTQSGSNFRDYIDAEFCDARPLKRCQAIICYYILSVSASCVKMNSWYCWAWGFYDIPQCKLRIEGNLKNLNIAPPPWPCRVYCIQPSLRYLILTIFWTIAAVSLKLCVFARVGETKLTASVAISCSNTQVRCYSKDQILIQAILKVFRHWHHEGCCLMGCSQDFKSVRKMQKFEATWNNDWQPAWEVWFRRCFDSVRSLKPLKAPAKDPGEEDAAAVLPWARAS